MAFIFFFWLLGVFLIWKILTFCNMLWFFPWVICFLALILSCYHMWVLLFLVVNIIFVCAVYGVSLRLCLFGFYLPPDYIKIYVNFIQVLLWFHLFYFTSLIHLEFILVSMHFFVKPSTTLSVHRSKCCPYGVWSKSYNEISNLGLRNNRF